MLMNSVRENHITRKSILTSEGNRGFSNSVEDSYAAKKKDGKT